MLIITNLTNAVYETKPCVHFSCFRSFQAADISIGSFLGKYTVHIKQDYNTVWYLAEVIAHCQILGMCIIHCILAYEYQLLVSKSSGPPAIVG